MEVAFKVGLGKSIGFVLVKEYFEQRGTIGAKSWGWESMKCMGDIVSTLVGYEGPIVR